MAKRSRYADMTTKELLESVRPQSVSEKQIVDELSLIRVQVSELLAEKENSDRRCVEECNAYVAKMKNNDDKTITILTDKISKLSVENERLNNKCNAYVDDEETITILTDQITKISEENKRLKFQISQPSESQSKVKQLTSDVVRLKQKNLELSNELKNKSSDAGYICKNRYNPNNATVNDRINSCVPGKLSKQSCIESCKI